MNQNEIKMAIESGWLSAGLPAFSLAHSMYNLICGISKSAEIFPKICGWTEAHKRQWYYPKRLYHYTSMDGFNGILFSPVNLKDVLLPKACTEKESAGLCAIFVRRVGSSNDPSEGGKLCSELFNEVVSDLHKKGLVSEEYFQLLKDIISRGDAVYSQWPDVVEYIACFSSERDYLPMWNRYADVGGVSLGFDFQNMGLQFPLVYSKAEQIYCVHKACEVLNGIFEKEYLSNSSGVKREIVALFEFFSARFKSSAYSYEKEWRMRIINNGNEFESKIVSGEYLLIALPKSCLKEVILSPNTPETQMNATQDKLNSGGYNCVVSISSIPYTPRSTVTR